MVSRKKLTVSASAKGLEKAKNALIRLGFSSKEQLAQHSFVARSTLTRFFNKEPIQLNSFMSICKALNLDWKEIAKIAEEEPKQLEANAFSSSDPNIQIQPQTLYPLQDHTDITDELSSNQNNLTKKQNTIHKDKKTIVIKLTGSKDSLNNITKKIFEDFMLNMLGDVTLTITKIED